MATHAFPGQFTFKVIGHAKDGFDRMVLDAIQAIVDSDKPTPHSIRESSGGGHVSITAEPNVENPEMVLDIYDRLRELPGVVMLL